MQNKSQEKQKMNIWLCTSHLHNIFPKIEKSRLLDFLVEKIVPKKLKSYFLVFSIQNPKIMCILTNFIITDLNNCGIFLNLVEMIWPGITKRWKYTSRTKCELYFISIWNSTLQSSTETDEKGLSAHSCLITSILRYQTKQLPYPRNWIILHSWKAALASS